MSETEDTSKFHIENQESPLVQQNNGDGNKNTQKTYIETQNIFLPPEARRIPRSVWIVPYRRNPFFTGRETLLAQLREHFIMHTSESSAQGLAINGLGGIGKTQLALEYAHRYRSTYSSTLWVSASSYETLLSDYILMADHLGLPERFTPDQNTIVASVRLWLENNKHWLLIIDNIEGLNLLESFLPTKNTGHILLTTRAQATGEFESFSLEQMDSTESTDLLLRRARITTSQISREHLSHTDQTTATQIAQEIHGLPLALDQAGAYIEETACSLSEYLALYQNQRKTLLAERGSNASHHPESVVATFLLSLQKIETTYPLAAGVLRACAFLDPDAIPEEIITEVTSELGSRFESVDSHSHLFHDAIKQLRKFSLLHRDSSQEILRLHRLVQVVIRDDMEVDTQYQWAVRTIQVVNKTFPSVIDVTTWAQCAG